MIDMNKNDIRFMKSKKNGKKSTLDLKNIIINIFKRNNEND